MLFRSSYDIMTDSPVDYLSGSMTTANNAGNYATMNPNDKASGITVSAGNLNASGTSGGISCRATLGIPTTGLWYWEALLVTNSNGCTDCGIAPSDSTFNITSNPVGTTATSYSLGPGGGASASQNYKVNNNTYTQWGKSITSLGTGVVYGFAFDPANGNLYFRDNTGWMNASNSNDATPTTAAFSGIPSATYYPTYSHNSGSAQSSQWNFNFGQQPFTYTPPTGYKALNTYNFTKPADSSLWFYGDTPDLMWIKNRSTTGLHTLTDTVRGMGLNLVTSSAAAETSYPGVTEMNKFGMSIINDEIGRAHV